MNLGTLNQQLDSLLAERAEYEAKAKAITAEAKVVREAIAIEKANLRTEKVAVNNFLTKREIQRHLSDCRRMLAVWEKADGNTYQNIADKLSISRSRAINIIEQQLRELKTANRLLEKEGAEQ